jgi:hypothetical protein
MGFNLTTQADLVYLTLRPVTYNDRWGIENPGSKQITRPSTYLLVGSIKTHIIDVLKGDRFEARSTKALVPEDPLSKEGKDENWKTWLQLSVPFAYHRLGFLLQ